MPLASEVLYHLWYDSKCRDCDFVQGTLVGLKQQNTKENRQFGGVPKRKTHPHQLWALLAEHTKAKGTMLNWRWLWVKIQIVPPVNIPIHTKIGSKMGGEFTKKTQHGIQIGVVPRPHPNFGSPENHLRSSLGIDSQVLPATWYR